MPRSNQSDKLAFSAKPLFREGREHRTEAVTNLRNYFFEKFKRHITLLLEQTKSRKVPSQKGFLNSRQLHKYQYSDNIFQKTIKKESSDTTIVFLIDGSGSMDGWIDVPTNQDVTMVEMCGAVASAFAKANHTVLKGQIPVEVFIKSAPPCYGQSLTGTKNGSLVTLSRVFSSSKRNADFDSLCKLTTNSPIMINGRAEGSYTSEYAVLPALQKWIMQNVKTKKCIVFNLTDGEAYCSLGIDDYQFRSTDTKAMRIKYLRGIPNLTLMLGGREDARMKDIYGENMINANTDFAGALFRTFAGFLA